MTTPKLFSPVKVGNLTLQHRVVLAPMTRLRAHKSHAHSKLAVEFYGQRASSRGTLLITESTIIAPRAAGYYHMPGLWNDEHIGSWKAVVDAVHAKGSYIFLQLCAVGRLADPTVLEQLGTYPVVSASDIQVAGRPYNPRPLTISEIKEYTQLFAIAASNAVDHAGFDGVEIHCANGSLLDQFIQDVSNKRTDDYGGSVENRGRFPLEVIEAVAEKIGVNKVGVRFSPWSEDAGMRMDDPVPTYSYIVRQLAGLFSDLAYIHVIEPRGNGSEERVAKAGESNEFIRKIWQPRTLIRAGGYNREQALEVAEKGEELIAFGRYFTSNPDLPLRLKSDLPLTPYDRSTFYVPESATGYIDWALTPTSAESD